ncbi:putative sugar epimerase YhfK [Bremerella volcania]|uniref:Putative sugar epimerase YhfK n=1 Tax=Bremerella volcania TaxID=2527984 RepID=A0A518C2R8_9BACT|nr:SDR family oxidoreductase [Bremerella volcania]QDU73521.1 putative sugar epimerase YhfK [Bremerella volcania]
MSHVFIIGSTGGVGSRLVTKLIQAGHTVTGLHRKPEQAETLKASGAQAHLGDIIDMTVEDLTAATKDCDVVVFSAGAAGSGPERTTAIDGGGVIKMMDAAQANGIKRVYLVSAFPDARRDAERKEGFEHYIRTKRMADNALAATDLDWVILRPATLVTEEGNGKVKAGLAIPYGTVARGNVAAFLAALIERPEIRREIIELTDGEVPVKEAVAALVRS